MIDLRTFADVKTATKNKVPLVRSLTLNWVTFCIETSNKAVILKAHKEYVPICMEVSSMGYYVLLFLIVPSLSFDKLLLIVISTLKSYLFPFFTTLV